MEKKKKNQQDIFRNCLQSSTPVVATWLRKSNFRDVTSRGAVGDAASPNRINANVVSLLYKSRVALKVTFSCFECIEAKRLHILDLFICLSIYSFNCDITKCHNVQQGKQLSYVF